MDNIMQQQEAMRQRTGQSPSSMGLSSAPMGQASSMGTSSIPGGAAGFQSSRSTQGLQKQQPDEAMMIVKSLAQRLKDLTPKQPKQQTMPAPAPTPAQPMSMGAPQVNGAELALQALQGSTMQR